MKKILAITIMIIMCMVNIASAFPPPPPRVNGPCYYVRPYHHRPYYDDRYRYPSYGDDILVGLGIGVGVAIIGNILTPPQPEVVYVPQPQPYVTTTPTVVQQQTTSTTITQTSPVVVIKDGKKYLQTNIGLVLIEEGK